MNDTSRLGFPDLPALLDLVIKQEVKRCKRNGDFRSLKTTRAVVLNAGLQSRTGSMERER